MTRKILLSFAFAMCVATFSLVAAADIEVGMGPCTEKNGWGSFPEGGNCTGWGCYPKHAGCEGWGCWLPGGGCGGWGCWPQGGSCNGWGCTKVGECSGNGCPEKISGQKIKYTCALNAGQVEKGAMQPKKSREEEKIDSMKNIQNSAKRVIAEAECHGKYADCEMKALDDLRRCTDDNKDREKCIAKYNSQNAQCVKANEDCIARIRD